MNVELAAAILAFLKRAGVDEICLCPGARSAPFVFLLDQSPAFRVYSFFDERSASFFALGRIKVSKKPVALITTSGTAVTEASSAVVEAYYTGLPFIVLSADRPKYYRGTGAPQTIEQPNIYGVYAPTFLDIDRKEDLDAAINAEIPKGPLHLNVCFDEPLIDADTLQTRSVFEQQTVDPAFDLINSSSKQLGDIDRSKMDRLSFFLSRASFPLALVSGLTKSERDAAVPFLLALKIPIYAEATAGLGAIPELAPFLIRSGEHNLSLAGFDSVLRIGSVPTTRYWRDLEIQLKQVSVLHLSSLRFRGLTRGESIEVELEYFFKEVDTSHLTASFSSQKIESFLKEDQKKTDHLKSLLKDFPNSELGLLSSFVSTIGKDSSVFIGNSLPIRELDLVVFDHLNDPVFSNRGANGIDGQLSCFLGTTDPSKTCWGIFGDLTTLCDLVAPWILQSIRASRIGLVVINNQGGKIFSRLFKPQLFQNNHNLGFKHWAEMWGIRYEKIVEPITEARSIYPVILELSPDAVETRLFWEGYQRIFSK